MHTPMPSNSLIRAGVVLLLAFLLLPVAAAQQKQTLSRLEFVGLKRLTREQVVAMRILWGHLVELYQFFDDFARQRELSTAAALFQLMSGLKQACGAVFALRYGKICDESHLISNSCPNSETRP